MIFDGHSDIWTDVIVKQKQGETDILNKHHYNKLVKGGISGSIFVIWTDPPYDVTTLNRTKEIMESVRLEMKYASNNFQIVHDYDEYISAVGNGKIGLFIGLEGLSCIGENIDMINELYEFGARHASLTWNEENELATGAKGDESRGLTELGQKAYKRISNLNMLFDISHLNEKSFWDVVRIADKPIIASHSNCKSICNVPRNLTDSQIKEIAASGGYIGINSFNQFVHHDVDKQNIESLVDHIVHISDLVGVNHVSFGFDYCEYIDDVAFNSFCSEGTSFTAGLADVSESKNIIIEMKKRGFLKEEIEMVSNKNITNLIRKIL